VNIVDLVVSADNVSADKVLHSVIVTVEGPRGVVIVIGAKSILVFVVEVTAKEVEDGAYKVVVVLVLVIPGTSFVVVATVVVEVVISVAKYVVVAAIKSIVVKELVVKLLVT
jgi:hypothetical protein